MDSLPALNSRVERIAVVGLGNVGRLIADMLVERGFDVREVDADESRVTGERASVMDVSDAAALEKVFADVDAVICCLPYYLTAGTATAAHSAGAHYLDLSEDVEASRTVRELARSSNTVFVPRCGLAPGFICIAGSALAAGLETAERNKLGQELKKHIVEQQWVIGTVGFYPVVRVIGNKMKNVPERYAWVTRARTPGAALPSTYYLEP